jgi:F-type H+-transporting ATPase subunit gamma
MKALAMTSIQEAENAVESLGHYYRTVRLGLQIALRHQPADTRRPHTGVMGATGILVFGSAWGMCGRFNELLAEYTVKQLDQQDWTPRRLVGLGSYIGGALETAGRPADSQYGVPDSVSGITERVQELLMLIEEWRTVQSIDRVLLFYNESTSGAGYGPQVQYLLPLDEAWLNQLEAESWPTHVLPTFRGPWSDLFARLVRQYLFVSLYRAFAETLASEHSSRLAAMQAAEENVEERLHDLQAQFHHVRQSAITEELLDITSGFEALKTDASL